jgi:hypothetical protein
VAEINIGALELVLLEVPFEVLLEVLLEVLFEVLFEVLLVYGAHTFGSWSAAGSWVKNPSSNPSRYDLDNRQVIHKVPWYVS